MPTMSGREFVDQEMRRELIARRDAMRRRRKELESAAQEIAQIDQTLIVIEEELAAYGYVEEKSDAVPAPAG